MSLFRKNKITSTSIANAISIVRNLKFFFIQNDQSNKNETLSGVRFNGTELEIKFYKDMFIQKRPLCTWERMVASMVVLVLEKIVSKICINLRRVPMYVPQ